MELKEGMYVRLDRCQGIRKIEEYEEETETYKLDWAIGDAWGDETWDLDEKDIIGEPSFNIINLIEVGDYVNGREVRDIFKMNNDILLYFKNDYSRHYDKTYKIKSIVTKEQFEQMKYEVE